MIDREDKSLSVRKQCKLLGLPRSTIYYEAVPETEDNLQLMKQIDEQYTKRPAMGSRAMTGWLGRRGHGVNRKRTQRLMQTMGLAGMRRKRNLSIANKNHRKFPYLLRDYKIDRPNQVWSTDITYIPLQGGYAYLTAVIDWHSRYVLSWELSNTLDASFCIRALERALKQYGRPEIFNTDQGCQFTSEAFIEVLESRGIQISMDGKGRALDNVFIERLWRSVKHEEVYLRQYSCMVDAYANLEDYFRFYNTERPHQALGRSVPYEVYHALEANVVNL